VVAAADCNLDGVPDLVWQNPSTGAAQIRYMGGFGGVTIQSYAQITNSNAWRILAVAAEPARELFAYGGTRPGEGSFATEDDGTSLRELPWWKYKKQVDRWFIWESTYYNDYQNGRGNTNVFTTAQTFGYAPTFAHL
jgi:hypothetical protein